MPALNSLALLWLVCCLVLAAPLAHGQKKDTPAASATAEDPIALIDRALVDATKNPRLRDALTAARDESVALQRLIVQWQLRRELAERAKAESEKALQQLQSAPLPDLLSTYREKERSDPNSATEWLRQQESALLEAQQRWQTEVEEGQRPVPTERPLELANPPETPFGTTDPLWQPIQSLVQLQRDRAERLWQEALKAETAAREARRRLAEAQLKRMERLLSQLEKLRIASPTTEAWRKEPLWQEIEALRQRLQAQRQTTQEGIAQLQEAQQTLHTRQQALAQEHQRLTQRTAAQGLTPLLSHQLSLLKRDLALLFERSTEEGRRAATVLSRWQQTEALLIQGEQRHAYFTEAVRAFLANLPADAQPSARRAFEQYLQEVLSDLSRLAALRDSVIQSAAELEATATEVATFCDQTLAKVQGTLLWATSTPPWPTAAKEEFKMLLTALATLVQAAPKVTDLPPLGLAWTALPLLLLGLLLKNRTGLAHTLQQQMPSTAPTEPAPNRATVRTLLTAAILAGDLPLLLVTTGTLLWQTPHPYLTAAGTALLQTALLLWNLRFWLLVLTYHGGLLAHRYYQPSSQVARLTRVLHLFIWITVSTASLVAFLLALPAYEDVGGAVRTLLLLEAFWLSLFIGWLFWPRRAHTLLARLPSLSHWSLWWLVTLPPLISAGLLLLGYRYAGEGVLLAYWQTLWALLSLLLVYDLIRRTITAHQQQPLAVKSSEEAHREILPENGIALPEATQRKRQMHQISRWGLWGLLGLMLWWIWQPLLPALQRLNEWILWRYQEGSGPEAVTFAVSLADLLFTIVGALLLILLTRHAPLLLEVGLVRIRRLDAGAQYAAVTLFRYLLVAVGVGWILNQLGMPWSKLQWLVAALSVGLGFGLQEIVANFVSGLIILFERPIRVGDLVTIQGTTGIVKQITIRATIIETADKKEELIPNKSIITGTVTNWTLSNPQSRLVLPVGVAYGSNLQQVCEVLLEVARAHPNVLSDPEPSVAFRQFGASSVDFELRCYVADIAVRLQTLTELAIAITRAFTERGIEIPFPQQEIHLRSVSCEAAAALKG